MDYWMAGLSDVDTRIEKMAVRKISSSGKQDELLDDAGISARHIVALVKKLIKK